MARFVAAVCFFVARYHKAQVFLLEQLRLVEDGLLDRMHAEYTGMGPNAHVDLVPIGDGMALLDRQGLDAALEAVQQVRQDLFAGKYQHL